MPRLLRSLLGLLSELSNRLLAARRDPPSGAPAEREPTPQARRLPKQPPYDLSKDTSTDNQKYLM
jgi:hypothetical protein